MPPQPGWHFFCLKTFASMCLGTISAMVTATPFVDVPTAIEEIQAGRMIVVVDDENRENEGDLTLAAEFVTPEAINFMARFGRGLICLALTEDRADHLRLRPMTEENTSRFGTAFTESIEAREGVTTGISAHDRAHTIRIAIDPKSGSSGPGATGTRISSACSSRWRTGACGTNGSFGRFGAHGRTDSCRSDLRNHEG